tara:strand:+ start:88 stop:282 length:195 start_codon:yes stop_codon:yes gene_type:complete
MTIQVKTNKNKSSIYTIKFEYYDEVEAENEMDALLISTAEIYDWIGSEAIVEEKVEQPKLEENK